METPFEAARRHFLQGLEHIQTGQLAQAETCFEAALAIVPGRVSTLTNLGATRVNLGKFDAALTVLEAACEAEPGNFEAWSYRGRALLALKRPGEALQSFDRAAAIDPGLAALWLHRSEAQLKLRQLKPALQSLDRALAIDPAIANAWGNRGTVLRELNRPQEAAVSYEKAIALGSDSPMNTFYLASLRGGGAPAGAPRAYVERLFDDCAHEFQGHLLGALAYRAHEMLIGRLLKNAPVRFRSVMDLGCGTGLCGPLIRPVADRLAGLDLSQVMLDQAALMGVYDQLIHADALAYLQGQGRQIATAAAATDLYYDLVLATDVFIYLGDLAGLFAAVAACLHHGGKFCFTLEKILKGAPGTGIKLLPSLRYAHSEAYVRTMAAQHGFAVNEFFEAPLREEHGAPVAGLYVVLSRP